MKALIIEDEILAAENLKILLRETEEDIEIVSILQSIEESLEWFSQHPMPDLVFMDIHLADGSSFSIFEEIEITCPVIFTTAYDAHALKAFEVNSIDYLLKPLHREELKRALAKFRKFSGETVPYQETIKKLLTGLQQTSPGYKSYFLVPAKDKLIPLAVKEIAYICIDFKLVKAFTYDHKTYILDYTLDELMEQLNPHDFFRANRQFIIAHEAIKDLTVWFGSKLSVNLKIPVPERIIVSKNRVKDFKIWFAE